MPADAAHDLLEAFGSLRHLTRASAAELVTQHGLGRATARRVVAALGLGVRVAGEPLVRGARLSTSQQIFEAYHVALRDVPKERFLTVLVDGKNRVVGEVQVSEGILTASLVHPREVFSPAIRAGAAGMVLIHNHPSGDPEPSPEDHEVTRRLVAVGDLVGIRVLDHVVIGDGRYVSFLERGWLAT
jgi:DNA repair protein RadC